VWNKRCLSAGPALGDRCDIRPDASTMSDNEKETIVIAVISSVSGLFFLILLIVCICVMSRRKHTNAKVPYVSEFDERTSIATRSVKGFDDFPTFAMNPAFHKPPPSIVGGPTISMQSQPMKMFNNPTYHDGEFQLVEPQTVLLAVADEEGDPAVYRA